MTERPSRKTESSLQGHLAARPELLSAEAAEDQRRRWLLVHQEMGIADQEEELLKLDHLRRSRHDPDLGGGRAQ